ncbi:MAG: hypothetical protein ABIF10_00915 [Candidatus Woesearchaeota archaeon]
MPHWSLYKDFPVKGFEKTVELISTAANGRQEGKEARQGLATRGMYKTQIVPESVFLLCRKTEDHYSLSVFHKKNVAAAETIVQKIRNRL